MLDGVWLFKIKSKAEQCREMIRNWVGITGGTQNVTCQETKLEGFQAGVEHQKPLNKNWPIKQVSTHSTAMALDLNLTGIQMRNSECCLGPKLITVLTGYALRSPLWAQDPLTAPKQNNSHNNVLTYNMIGLLKWVGNYEPIVWLWKSL